MVEIMDAVVDITFVIVGLSAVKLIVVEVVKILVVVADREPQSTVSSPFAYTAGFFSFFR